MSDRFFVEFPITGDSAVLTGQEAIHLTRVLRSRVGDTLLLFDGSDAEYSACIREIKKDAVVCGILERHANDRELPHALTLGVALPKGDRQRTLVEKLTELGVTSLTPLVTERSVVQPDDHTVQRLRRAVIEAAKQCGRNRLMQVARPRQLVQFVAEADPASLRGLAHPQQNSTSQPTSPALHLAQLANRNTPSVTIAIGPEGGFTDEEVDSVLRAGWTRIDLGPRILRVETAAIAVATVGGIQVPRTRKGTADE